MLAGLFRAPSTGIRTVTGMLDITGANYSTNVYHTNSNNTFAWTPAQITIQLGQSGTPPTRQDPTIGSVFGNAPENAPSNNLVAGYNSGLGKLTISGVPISPTGGTGTIREFVKFIRTKDTSSGTRTIIYARTLTNVASFIGGESINVDWEILI